MKAIIPPDAEEYALEQIIAETGISIRCVSSSQPINVDKSHLLKLITYQVKIRAIIKKISASTGTVTNISEYEEKEEVGAPLVGCSSVVIIGSIREVACDWYMKERDEGWICLRIYFLIDGL
ncbi:hypothetical protein ACTXT7_004034 [Hymenolepis weldensis]